MVASQVKVGYWHREVRGEPDGGPDLQLQRLMRQEPVHHHRRGRADGARRAQDWSRELITAHSTDPSYN